jgi:hypothetical protein
MRGRERECLSAEAEGVGGVVEEWWNGGGIVVEWLFNDCSIMD